MRLVSVKFSDFDDVLFKKFQQSHHWWSYGCRSMPAERLPAKAERCLGRKKPGWLRDFLSEAATNPDRTVRNFRASAESGQEFAAIEVAGSASDEGVVTNGYHCHSSCYFQDLKVPL